MKYDYLIVGAGLFGATFAHEVSRHGLKCLVIDRRNHVGGNCHTELVEGIQVHQFGPHCFHTNSKSIWEFVNRFAEFNNYQHRVKAISGGKVYSLPFNMQTFYELWGTTTPQEAMAEIDRQRVSIQRPTNLEEWALSQVGRDIYDKLIYGYTKKQWFRDPKELPAAIIRRLPLRFTYDDRYHRSNYSGVPIQGFTHMVENMLDSVEVRLRADFTDIRNWRNVARNLVYSGSIDQFFNYEFGYLEHVTLQFDTQIVDGDFQGIAQINYSDESVPYTRIVEHKHFYAQQTAKSVITYEYPIAWQPGKPPYVPVNDKQNMILYESYKKKWQLIPNLIGGGRLFDHCYYDMDQTIAAARTKARQELGHVAKDQIN